MPEEFNEELYYVRLSMKPFTRLELQLMRDRAAGIARGCDSTYWLIAYNDLMMAADRLDAMFARIEVSGQNS